ncbi:hypothetical protein GGF37_004727, partial [Kickxella alabastrina]
MGSSLRSTNVSVASTSVAVAYSAASTLGSTTAIVGNVSTFEATQQLLSTDSSSTGELISLAHVAEIASVAAAAGSKVTNILVAASGLVKLLPVLRNSVKHKQAVVLHVAVESAADIGKVLELRDSGCGVVRSTSRQQAVDFAVAASLAAQKLAMPIIHCFSADSTEGEAAIYATGQEEFAAYLKSEDATVAAALEIVGAQAVSYVGGAEATLVYVTFGTGLVALPSNDTSVG